MPKYKTYRAFEIAVIKEFIAYKIIGRSATVGALTGGRPTPILSLTMYKATLKKEFEKRFNEVKMDDQEIGNLFNRALNTLKSLY